MPRHSKNNTANPIYTYHEKKIDSSFSGYGTASLRLGKDSIKEFDCCSLTLQPCRNPVITPDGYLYDKEAILEYIIHQKKEIARKLKEYERQKQSQERESQKVLTDEQDAKLKSFIERQSVKVSASTDQGGSSISNVSAGQDKQLPSFWIPSLTPSAKESKLQKPDETVRCPSSGKPLKMKDLIDIKFTLLKDNDKRSLITKDARYVCAVTNDVLGNSVPCAALRTSGNVVTMECVEKLIKKDMIDPTNGAKMTDKDIIVFQRGSTGFSASGIELTAKKKAPVILA